MSIHDRAAVCDVVSKPAGWDEMSRQPMNGETIRGPRKSTRAIIRLLVDHDDRSRAGDIAQRLFISEHHTGIRIGADAEQTGGKAGVDQACDAPALELMLIE